MENLKNRQCRIAYSHMKSQSTAAATMLFLSWQRDINNSHICGSIISVSDSQIPPLGISKCQQNGRVENAIGKNAAEFSRVARGTKPNRWHGLGGGVLSATCRGCRSCWLAELCASICAITKAQTNGNNVATSDYRLATIIISIQPGQKAQKKVRSNSSSGLSRGPVIAGNGEKGNRRTFPGPGMGQWPKEIIMETFKTHSRAIPWRYILYVGLCVGQKETGSPIGF